MFSGIRYNTTTGEILCTVQTNNAADFAAYKFDEFDVLPHTEPMSDPNNFYVSTDKKVLERLQPSPTVNGLTFGVGEIVTITGLPTTSCYLFNSFTGQTTKITTGTYSFTGTEKGSVWLRLVGRHKAEWTVTFDDLANAKEKAKLEIDNAAEAARARVITPGAGQAMTYLRKADAARLFLDGATLTDAQQQRLGDEAARLGTTVQQAAESLVGIAEAWEAIDATIDNLRLTRKASIDAATTVAQVQSIKSTITWPV